VETTFSQSQQQALVSLLADADNRTADLVKNELIQSGRVRLAEYERLLERMTGKARARLSEVIQQIETADALGNISRGLARLRTFAQAEDLCWELARAEQPGFKAMTYRRALDSWAEGLKPLVAAANTGEDRVKAVTDYMAGEQRLTGNTLDYYHPRNCFLPSVIEFRCGLPITLTLIYILVGKRAGLDIEGISAPGHFLARLDGIIFDPYHGGRVITASEWEKICDEVPPTNRDGIKQACSPVNLVHRLLINLRNSHVKRDNTEGRRRIDTYLAVLQR
jgi:hypothetical protein